MRRREFIASVATGALHDGRSAMGEKDVAIGRVINIAGMIGVLSGIVLFISGIVLALFRHGVGFDFQSAFRWFW